MLPVFNQDEAYVFGDAVQQYRKIFDHAVAEESAAREIEALLAEQLSPAAARLLTGYVNARRDARRACYTQYMAAVRVEAATPSITAEYQVAYLVSPPDATTALAA